MYIYQNNISYYSYGLDEIGFGFNDPSNETVWCCCLVNNEKLLLRCIYRPGDASRVANREINKVFVKANELAKKRKFSGLLIAGDFNYEDIEWNESLQRNLLSNCSKHKEFLENVEESRVYFREKIKSKKNLNFYTKMGIMKNLVSFLINKNGRKILRVKMLSFFPECL